MLKIQSRDGAARLASADLGGRKALVPAILWVDSELAPAEAHFEPQLSSGNNADAAILATTSFETPAPTSDSGQLVLQRQLLAPPSMAPNRIRLHDLAGQVAVLHGAYSLAKNPKRFAPALAKARTEAGYARLLYAPGLGEPSQLALLAYAGVDLFDGVPLSLAAAEGRYLTEHGGFAAASLTGPECACPICRSESPASFTEEELRRHNQYAAATELGVVRNAIQQGRLRELVEARVRSHPELTALMRRIDQASAHIEERAPVARRERLFANSKESLARVDITRFRRRIVERYRPDATAPILLLLPCSHRKPYSRSRTHRAFFHAIHDSGAFALVHELIVTSPLGVVPRELETTYPAAHYDVPVTGEWDEEEGRMIRELLGSVLARRTYPQVVSHLPKHTYELVKSLLPANTLVTCLGEDSTKSVEVDRLASTLRTLSRDFRRHASQAFLERVHGIASYQFGADAARTLVEGAHVTGRWPVVKLAHGKVQLAMLPPDRGLLSLTLDGAKRLRSAGVYQVEIEDFPVTGSIFAVGVKNADPQIRVGDDVIVVHGDEVRAVGVATMTGPEMTECERGEAVKVRHHA